MGRWICRTPDFLRSGARLISPVDWKSRITVTRCCLVSSHWSWWVNRLKAADRMSRFRRICWPFFVWIPPRSRALGIVLKWMIDPDEEVVFAEQTIKLPVNIVVISNVRSIICLSDFIDSPLTLIIWLRIGYDRYFWICAKSAWRFCGDSSSALKLCHLIFLRPIFLNVPVAMAFIIGLPYLSL